MRLSERPAAFTTTTCAPGFEDPRGPERVRRETLSVELHARVRRCTGGERDRHPRHPRRERVVPLRGVLFTRVPLGVRELRRFVPARQRRHEMRGLLFAQREVDERPDFRIEPLALGELRAGEVVALLEHRGAPLPKELGGGGGVPGLRAGLSRRREHREDDGDEDSSAHW